MSMEYYPIGTILIGDLEKWREYLKSLFARLLKEGKKDCLKYRFEDPDNLEIPIHIQTLRQGNRLFRFISKGNIRYLLWLYMCTQGPTNNVCPEPFADTPVTRQDRTLQFQVNDDIAEEDIIRRCAEMDLFGYMYTGGSQTRARKAVLGITKMVNVGSDGKGCWKISFAIDVARLGRLTEHKEILIDPKEFRNRLTKALDAIYHILIKPAHLALVGLARVPVPVFDPYLTSACTEKRDLIAQAICEALQNGWVVRNQKVFLYPSHVEVETPIRMICNFDELMQSILER